MEIKSFKKGEKFRYKSSGREFKIHKGSRNIVTGMIIVKFFPDDIEKEMSCDFLKRQLHLGFVEKV